MVLRPVKEDFPDVRVNFPAKARWSNFQEDLDSLKDLVSFRGRPDNSRVDQKHFLSVLLVDRNREDLEDKDFLIKDKGPVQKESFIRLKA